jgi:excisionase family DNA binding protein
MDKDEFLRPEEAAKILKVSKQTLINWDNSGLLSCIRTKGNHRRYRKSDIISKLSNQHSDQQPNRRSICYCRVSTPSQKEDLERQADFFRGNYPNHEIIRDVGSGINFKRKGFNSILDLAITGNLQEVVVTHKDRLCRFGFDFYERIIREYSNGKIVVLDQKETSPTEELTNDLISIITVFSSRLYGLRSHKLKNKIKKEAIKNLEDASLSD